MGSGETHCSQVTRLKPFKPLKLAPHEAVCPLKSSSNGSRLLMKQSAYEANNLIPFEEPPLKVFDPYSGIYFITGLRHRRTASSRTSHCQTSLPTFKKIFSLTHQKDAGTRSKHLSIPLLYGVSLQNSLFSFFAGGYTQLRLFQGRAAPRPPASLALHSHKAAIICKLVLSARPLHYG